MKRLVAVSTFALVACGALTYLSQLNANDLARPAVTVSLKQIGDVSKGQQTYKIQNRLDQPVWLQAQPESGMGHFIQKQELKDGKWAGQLSVPQAINLGSRLVKLAGGETLDFVYDSGTSPTGFRLGVMYSLTQDGDQWTLVWGPWYVRR